MKLKLDKDIFGEYEVINTVEIGDFTKHRLAFEDAKADISIVDEDKEEFIANRKEELKNTSVEVPHPYTSDMQEEVGEINPVNFRKKDEKEYGLGYANSEYNLVRDDADDIIRYRYLITWKKSGGKVIEAELYIPKDVFDLKEGLSLVESIEL